MPPRPQEATENYPEGLKSLVLNKILIENLLFPLSKTLCPSYFLLYLDLCSNDTPPGGLPNYLNYNKYPLLLPLLTVLLPYFILLYSPYIMLHNY